MSGFNYIIIHRPAALHGKADALSRRPDYMSNNQAATTVLPDNVFVGAIKLESKVKQLSSLSFEDFISHTSKDLFAQKIMKAPTKGFVISKGVIGFKNHMYVLKSLRSIILAAKHDALAAEHFGIKKTGDLVSREFW